MKLRLYIIALFFSFIALGQSNLGFYHMQHKLPQGSNYNASFFPNAKVYVSLPVISGIDLNISNGFSLNDVLTPTGDSTLFDIDRFLSEHNDNPYGNMNVGITDFMVGVRLDDKSHFSMFINERIIGTIYYPVDFLNFAWRGNGEFIGQSYVSDDLAYNMTAYREMGVGYARKFNIAGFNTNIGVRLKYLTGLVHSSSTENVSMSVHTADSDYEITARFNESTLQSAGMELLEDDVDPSYFINSGNSGFGVDLGVSFDFNEKLSFGLAINDLGFINWKANGEKVLLDGEQFSFSGTDMDNIDNFAEALMDSIDAISFDTVKASFRTKLHSNTFLSASYQVSNDGYAMATIGNYFSQGRTKTSFGVGYLHHVDDWFSVTTTVSAIPQQGLDMGAGFMIKGGCVQFYAMADQFFNTVNIPEARALNFKFGINLLFGQNSLNVIQDEKIDAEAESM